LATRPFHCGTQLEVDDGEWDLYLGPVKFGRFHEPLLNVEDAFGRLARHHAKV